jgi:hypothetical protein
LWIGGGRWSVGFVIGAPLAFMHSFDRAISLWFPGGGMMSATIVPIVAGWLIICGAYVILKPAADSVGKATIKLSERKN